MGGKERLEEREEWSEAGRSDGWREGGRRLEATRS